MDEKFVRLDEEYKVILKIIKHSIVNCQDPTYVTLCGQWLQRLEDCGNEEKYIRNQYLMELCRQLKDGALCEPFNSPPPMILNPEAAVNDEESWSDVSTVSTMEIAASGDTNDGELFPEPECEENTGLQNLANDVEYLKGRLKDLIRVKKKLQKSHDAAVTQWERRARMLEEKLSVVLTENDHLRSAINGMESSLDNQELEAQIHQLKEVHMREINEIRNRQFQLLKHLDEKHALELKEKEAESNAKIEQMKLIYETRIASLNAAKDESINSLTAEKEKLQALVEETKNRNDQDVIFLKTGSEQEKNANTEALQEKIIYLQNCIETMEKLLAKYEKYYKKKVDSLKKQLREKNNVLQIQLAAQRAELLAKASSEKHADVENVVSQLENRYKELLDEQNARASQADLEQSEIMQQLSSKLESL